jgi:hypothetical protein
MLQNPELPRNPRRSACNDFVGLHSPADLVVFTAGSFGEPWHKQSSERSRSARHAEDPIRGCHDRLVEARQSGRSPRRPRVDRLPSTALRANTLYHLELLCAV